MNEAVYKYLWRTYGPCPGEWFALATEITRTVLHRVITTLIVAQTATNLAANDLVAAKRHVLAFLLVYTLGAVIGLLGSLVAQMTENYQYVHLMMIYYHKLIGKDMSFYRDNQAGYLISLFRQYLDSMMLMVRFLRGDVARMIVSLVSPIIVLFVANQKLGLVVSGLLIIQIVYVLWSSLKASHYARISHAAWREMIKEVSDQMTNIIAFRSEGIEKHASQKVRKVVQEETKRFWQWRKIALLLDLPRELVTAIGITVAFFVVVSTTAATPTSVGLIILTLTYIFQIVRTVSEFPSLMTRHDDLVTRLYPTLEYLNNEHETIRDPIKPQRFTVHKGAISFRHVKFSYPANEGQRRIIPVFDDLNIEIKGGEQVGVVGLSGAGKSTLAGLLMRFDEANSGTIEIDGIDIRNVRQSDLHRKIAYVPQEPSLFHTTIRENIAYLNHSATDKAIVRAAKAAHAHEFIQKLPKGYNTIVGERGVKLSGGQKQRVAIARAALKNAPIMILDEATSALDTESEKLIQRALPKIIGKHTALIIAHRLSTVAGLDRIIVMDGGKIVESGTHAELLKLERRYHALWQKQVGGNAQEHQHRRIVQTIGRTL